MYYFTKTDHDGKAQVMFNPNTGLKIRMAEDGFDYVKSTTPELVDVKITNFCNYGCKNCYQSSTEEGQHGNIDYIYSVIRMLSRCKTFEIAIGGGEPATHPNFSDILEYCDYYNVKPNFTSFGTDWLDNPTILDAVKNYVGGIGVSVYSKQSVDKYFKIKDALKDSNVMVMVQHVAGMFPFATTYNLVKEVDHILLLGYKSVGFGKRKDPKLFTDEQIEQIMTMENKIISVDTAFLDNHGHVLDKLGIPKKLRSSPEGKFSCYIDAVDQVVGPSSYVEPSEMQKLDMDDSIHFNMHNFLNFYKEY